MHMTHHPTNPNNVIKTTNQAKTQNLKYQHSNCTGQPEQMHQIIVTPSYNRLRKWDERPSQPGIHIVLYCIARYPIPRRLRWIHK